MKFGKTFQDGHWLRSEKTVGVMDEGEGKVKVKKGVGGVQKQYIWAVVPGMAQSSPHPLTFKHRIKSHLPLAGVIRSSPYSTGFQDKG